MLTQTNRKNWFAQLPDKMSGKGMTGMKAHKWGAEAAVHASQSLRQRDIYWVATMAFQGLN